MASRTIPKVLLCVGLAMASFAHSSSESGFYRPTVSTASTHPLPIAIYTRVSADDLNKVLVEAFTEFNFSLSAARKNADGATEFEFLYPVRKDGKSGNVTFRFKVDGATVKGKCANCFLRWGEVRDESAMEKLAWMTHYDLRSGLYPDIDRAYAAIRTRLQAYMDPRHGFIYKNMWEGERNRLANSNAFVGIRLPDLKREIARAMSNAGFVLLRDSQPAADASDSSLVFVYPMGDTDSEGPAYSIQFASQFDADGLCYPCEARQVYDPHQTLPAPGLSGMAGRLTLASRFESSLASAHDQMKASTERFLRPRTQFVKPPKSAALGSSRPPMVPPPAT